MSLHCCSQALRVLTSALLPTSSAEVRGLCLSTHSWFDTAGGWGEGGEAECIEGEQLGCLCLSARSWLEAARGRAEGGGRGDAVGKG